MLRYSIISSPQLLSSTARLRNASQLLSRRAAINSHVSSQRYSTHPPKSQQTNAAPVTPPSQSAVPSEKIPKSAPSPPSLGQASPPTSIPPRQSSGIDANEATGASSIPPPPGPPTPKSGRVRRFLIYFILASGLAYGGGVFLALRYDNFHDFFTEYVPYGEESVLYFEERDFHRRFPNATRHANRIPPIHRDESNKVTIPGKSGLSWKVSGEDDSASGSDLTQKGRHMSAVESNDPKEQLETVHSRPQAKSETVKKAKADRAAKEEAKRKTEPKSDSKPEPPKIESKPESREGEQRTPIIDPVTTIELLNIKAGDDPVVQELMTIFNDIITVISADKSADRFSVPINKAKSELASVGEKVASLRAEAKKAADEEIQKAHATFDESARELIRRIDEVRAAEAAQFREEFETEREKISKAYQEKVKTELQRSHEIAEQRLQNELVEQAIELNRKYVNDVKGLVEKEREGRLSKLSELSANVNQLEKLASSWSDIIESNLRTQQLQVAIDAVRTVLEQADRPRPFVRELIAVKELAADNPVVAAAIASINPSSYQRGIPPTAEIIDRFRRVSSEVRKASLLPEDAGIASHAAGIMLSKIMFKKDGLADGGDVESVLTRTENLLEEGNLDAAAREVNSLQGWAKILSKDWLADVRRVLEVKQALEVIETEARLQCLRMES